MKINIELERKDFDAMHDVILDALDYPDDKLTDDVIQSYWDKLPSHIKSIAISWGCNDTVFRDAMYVWLQKNKE